MAVIDAILVSSKHGKANNLVHLTFANIRAWLGKEWKVTRSERAKKNKEYLKLLSSIWENCVKKILGSAAIRI